MTKKDTIRQSKSPQIEDGLGNPTGGKEPQERATKSETQSPLLGEKNQHNKLMAIKYIQRSGKEPCRYAFSVFVSLFEVSFGDSVSHLLLVSSNYSGSFNLFSPTSVSFSDLQEVENN